MRSAYASVSFLAFLCHWFLKRNVLCCFDRRLTSKRVCACVCTCVSDRLSAVASSTLSGVDRYRWISNLFSRPDSCESEKTVRAFLRLQCFPGNSAWCWNKAGICIPTGFRWQRFRIRELCQKTDNKPQIIHRPVWHLVIWSRCHFF